MNYKFIKRYLETSVEKIIKEADVKSLIIAVSGGADSVALLTACCSISTRLGLRIEAVNCNFHLRGKESNRDSEFTARLCEALGVKLHAIEYNVDDYINEHPVISTEMACRELRYRDFFRIAEDGKFDRVAVAHNADDDIETMMLNMLRGSGSRGLKGMDIDNGKVIRPLLSISRAEIEKYLESSGIDYITDSSNLTNAYRRNFIRHDVLPLLEQRWHGARKSLSKTISIMKEEADIIEKYYRDQLSRLTIGKKALNVYSEDVTVGTIWHFIKPFGGNSDIAEEIKESLHKPFAERIWMMGERYKVILERDRLAICETDVDELTPVLIWTEIKMSEKIMNDIKGSRDHSSIYLPHGEDRYIFRKPQSGDRMAPLGMKGTRLVSDIISDAKLSTAQKSNIRLLARKADGEIIWVAGLKRSKYDLVKNYDNNIYKATIEFV